MLLYGKERQYEMEDNCWLKEFGASITVCDDRAIIIEMNDRAADTFKKYGGRDLIGKSLLDCHPEPARSKLVQLLKTHEINCYTIEKNGVKKIIYQAPWKKKDCFAGYVEISIEIPFQLHHFIRK